MKTQRIQAEPIDAAAYRLTEPTADWTPLHPMHIDLAERVTRYADPVIVPLPLPMRFGLVIGLAGACWFLLWYAARIAITSIA